MLTMIIVGALLVLLAGLGAKKVCDYRGDTDYQITWGEFGIASLVMLALVIPLTTWAGFKIAYSNIVTYEEFWHGYETEAQWTKTTCERDGWCYHDYDCDPYTVQVPYECGGTEGTGKDAHYVSKTCYRTETRYHSCPYTTEEWTFVVRTTLGDYTIAAHNLPTNPDSHRWRRSERVPSNLPSGIPQFWQAAHDRLAVNQPGPVAQQRSYENLILASEYTILKKYSSDVERYQKAGLLPKLDNPTNVHNFYWANRVYFVGTNPPGDWQKAARYFNAAFGSNLQGDLYTVVVDANKVTDPDTYIWALTAYWQSPEFGKFPMSKNGFLVVLGSKDGQTVEWARAATGMPKGNEALLIDIKNKLPGTKLTPEAVFGPPTGELAGSSVRITYGQSALESLLWGANKFDRIHMKDYGYLNMEIEPTDSQKNWMYVVIFLFGCVAWGICIAVGPKTFHRYRR